MGAHSGKAYATESGEPIHGILAEFATPAAVVHAAETVRDAGYACWDVHSPFPIHDMESSMGMARTKLPLAIGLVGLSGAGMGFLLQSWVSTQGYATMVQGKPFLAWQAFVPVTFELGILSAAFTALLGMLMLNGLPRWHHPLLKKERFLSVSDDRFFISVEASDPMFDPDKTRALLEKAGAKSIELVEE